MTKSKQEGKDYVTAVDIHKPYAASEDNDNNNNNASNNYNEIEEVPLPEEFYHNTLISGGYDNNNDNKNDNDDNKNNDVALKNLYKDSLEKGSGEFSSSIFIHETKSDKDYLQRFPFGWIEDLTFDGSFDSQSLNVEEMQNWFEKILFHVANKENFVREDPKDRKEADICFSTPVTPICRPLSGSDSSLNERTTPPTHGKRVPPFLEDKRTIPSLYSSPPDVINSVLDAERNSHDFYHLTQKCLQCLYNERDDPSILGPKHVFKIYSGQIPWSSQLEWLQTNADLFDLVVKAFRYAVKLGIDGVIFSGSAEVPPSDELLEALEELEEDWILGGEEEEEWRRSIVDEKPKLFAMGFDSQKGVYTSRVMTLTTLPAFLGRLDAEIVRSIWAELNLELLYMTNDDEERYSIQAHPGLLRNLIIQAAEPPLGYPVHQDSITVFTI